MENSYFTITACHRCRKRKARCDAGIPTCVNCESSGSTCEYTDPCTKERRPRAHLAALEREAVELELQIQRVKRPQDDFNDRRNGQNENEAPHDTADPADDNGRPEFIHSEAGGDGHFLGPSSGLNIARSILYSTGKGIGLFNPQKLRPLPDVNITTGQAHTQSTGDYFTEDARVALPQWDTMERLFEIFFRQYEVTHPILDQHEFLKDVKSVTSPTRNTDTKDPTARYMLDTVLSISYHLVSQGSDELSALAEKYRLHAAESLAGVIGLRGHRVLQCLLLLLLSSTLNPQSAPMWYISGICMRMCIDLGYHDETTIGYATNTYSTVNTDTKRRLLWVTYSFERSLAIMLGRPFFIDEDRIQVHLGASLCHSSTKRRHQSVHWFRMKRIESRIALYLMVDSDGATCSTISTNETALGLDTSINEWLAEAQSSPDLDIDDSELWEHAHATMKLMLHQPLLRKSTRLEASVSEAYNAAVKLIHSYFIRVQTGFSEFTWLDLHSHLISGLTLLFLTLKNAECRALAQKDWFHFKSAISEWTTASERLATTWTSVAKMKGVLSRLADDTLEKVQKSRARTERRLWSLEKQNFIETLTRDLRPGFSDTAKSPLTPRSEQSTRNHQSAEGNGLAGPFAGQRVNEGFGTWNDWEDTSDESRMADPNSSIHTHHLSYNPPPLLDEVDFSNILSGVFWADFDQSDLTIPLHVNPFTTDSLNIEPPGHVAGVGGGRLHSSMTDSVLNFQSDIEPVNNRP